MTDETAAEEPATDEATAEEGAGEPKPTGKMPGKKLILFIALPVLLLIGGGAGAYFTGLLDSLLGVSEEGATEELVEAPSGPSVYFEIPEMLVNLNSTGRKTGYLKISISLELGSEEDVVLLEGVMPRVVDGFQVYLRELRVEDLQGSAGLQRLREELLLRVASAAKPAQIKDVLFREMLIQ
jgi:flagellar protein FliL